MRIQLLITLLFVQTLFAQQPLTPTCPPNSQPFCENAKGISTNPNNPINPECPDLRNNFDWREQTASSNESYIISSIHSRTIHVQNPFTGPSDDHYTPFIAARQGSNYNPEDGWELLSVEFGTFGNMDVNNISGWYPNMPNNKMPYLPYMILYNKYTGTLRVFGAHKPHRYNRAIEIELRIPHNGSYFQSNSYQPNLKDTNLLSIQGESVQPLDRETDEPMMSAFVKCPLNQSVFFWFDIPVAYDPCICNNRVHLDVNFKYIIDSDIDVYGGVYGEIKTQNFGPAQKNFGRVLATGISPSAEVNSEGVVSNSSNVNNLINIYKNDPKTTKQQRENLSAIQLELDLVDDFTEIVNDIYPASLETKRKHRAGKWYLDANTTFMTSQTNTNFSFDNAGLIITDKIKAKGHLKITHAIPSSRITMQLPGSNWNEFILRFTFSFSGNGTILSSYPAYNERLGTFAMLETPK